MKLYITILLVSISIVANSHVKYSVTGLIVQDTVWNSDTIKVNNNMVIASSACLFIEPGVYIEFQGNYSIDVYGKILALGSEMDSIYFTINDTTGFSDTANYVGGWGSIKLLENNVDTSVFKYCNFSYGKATELGTSPFDEQNANLKGGAIYSEIYSNIIINNCSFNNNYATFQGGAVYISNADYVLIEENKFISNRTYSYGAGISAKSNNNIQIINNLFISNIVFRTFETNLGTFMAGSGAGIHTSVNHPIVKIINNQCYNNKCVDGVIYESNKNTKVINNIVVNNYGIGLLSGHSFGNQKVINNTVCNNSIGASVAGLMYFNTELVLSGNIFWGNENDPYYPVRQEIQCPQCSGQAISSYNCMKYGFYGEGSIDDYPQFANPTEGAGIDYDGLSADWSLLKTSPCINTGTPDTTGLNLPEFDIAGNPRVFGGRIDMGAYENQSVYVKINESPVYSKINVYPNPGNNEIYIDIPPEINGSWIDIVDGQGRVLMHEQIRMSPAMLSPYKLKSGIYYYRIYNENQVIKSGKWVKNGR